MGGVDDDRREIVCHIPVSGPARAPRRLSAGLACAVSLLALPTLLAPATAFAQAPASPPDAAAVAGLQREIAALRQEYDQRLADLEARLAEIAGAATPAPAAAEETEEIAEITAPEPEPVPAEPLAAVPSVGQAVQTPNYFNPAIAVVGNFLAVAGDNDVEDLPSAELRESEVSFQAVVDPYAKADLFLSFGEEGAEVEEGYITFTSLPASLLAKVGRMRVNFGKVNTLHLHSLPWADQPLPVLNLLGGDEGWIGTGVSVSRLFPLGDTFSEATVEVLRGDAEGLFEARKRSDLAYNGHYRLFRDLTESTNLDVGLSYAQGPGAGSASDEEGAGRTTRLWGVDTTFRWKPLRTSLYRSAIVRGELYRGRRGMSEAGGGSDATGWYVGADYQLARRWWTGARYESAERLDDPDLRDTGAALTLTFWPSEFAQLRGELRRREYALADTATELLLQLQFGIGTHGAHPF
jgi:hypothetical protein